LPIRAGELRPAPVSTWNECRPRVERKLDGVVNPRQGIGLAQGPQPIGERPGGDQHHRAEVTQGDQISSTGKIENALFSNAEKRKRSLYERRNTQTESGQ